MSEKYDKIMRSTGDELLEGAEKKQTDQSPKEWLDELEKKVIYGGAWRSLATEDLDRLIRMARKGLETDVVDLG